MLQKPVQLLLWVAICLLVLLTVYVFFMLDMLWTPFWYVIKTIFIPLIISIFISYLLLPVTEWLHGKGLPRTLSILVIYVLFLAGLAGRCIRGCLFSSCS